MPIGLDVSIFADIAVQARAMPAIGVGLGLHGNSIKTLAPKFD
jgi:hypothetical protein